MARRIATPIERLGIIETLFVRKRSNVPYRTIFVDGFDYAVRSSSGSRKKISIRYHDFVTPSGFPIYEGDDAESSDIHTALTLHCLNLMSIAAIRYMGTWLNAYDGRETPPDLGVDVDTLRIMYTRLRQNYTVDDVYEAVAAKPNETSYVINNGEEIHLCVRCGNKPDSKVVLIAVIAHELAHVASSTPDHDEEFWDHHRIMQKIIARLGIIDELPKTGEKHCGIVFIDREELSALYEPKNDPVDLPTPVIPDHDVPPLQEFVDPPVLGIVAPPLQEFVAPPVLGIVAPPLMSAFAPEGAEELTDPFPSRFVASRSQYTTMSDPTFVSFPEFTDRMYDAMRTGDREVPLGSILRAGERPNPKFFTYRRRTPHDLHSHGILHEAIIE